MVTLKRHVGGAPENSARLDWFGRHGTLQANCKRLGHTSPRMLSIGGRLRSRIRTRTQFVRILAGVSALSVLAIGCATMELPDYKAGKIEDYANSQIKNDLAVAVHPILEKSESKKYFGTSLLEANILAFLVVAENRGSKQTFLISKENFRLGKREIFTDKAARDERVGSVDTAKPFAVVGTVIPIASPLIIIAAKIFSDATVIKHNMAVKELTRKTISPGGRAEGFVYFALPEASTGTAKPLLLVAEIMRLQDEAVTRFEFDSGLTR